MKNNIILRENIIQGLLILFLLVEYRFFFLIKIPDFIQKSMTYQNKLLVFSLSVLLIFIVFIVKKDSQMIFSFKKEIYLFVSIIFVSFIYSILIYKPIPKEVIIPLFNYLTIIIYFPLVRSVKKDSFFRLMTYFNIFGCLILLIQGIVFYYSQDVFLHIYEFYRSGRIAMRDSTLRITYLGTIVSFSTIYSVGTFFDTKILKHRSLHMINILISLLYFTFISQTRMYILTIVLSIFFVTILWLYFEKKFLFKKAMYFIVPVSLIFLVTLIYRISSPILDGTFLKDGSYFARIQGVTYYGEIILKKPLVGNGIFDPIRENPFFSIVHGKHNYLYYSDLGMFGTTAKLGIPILVWFLWVLNKMRKIICLNKKYVLISLFFFIIFSSVSLSVLNPQRISFLALSFYLFDYYSNNIDSKMERV